VRRGWWRFSARLSYVRVAMNGVRNGVRFTYWVLGSEPDRVSVPRPIAVQVLASGSLGGKAARLGCGIRRRNRGKPLIRAGRFRQRIPVYRV
jgi:hypothetical protein